MHSGRIVLAQIMDFMSKYEFAKCVQRYRGDYHVHEFSCWNQFLAMVFAQLTFRESLREIETCLQAGRRKLYHCGIDAHISRSTLADANEHRSWRIYADFAQTLIGTARRLYAHESLAAELQETAYAFDASTIDLCLSLFPWARFRKRKAAIRLHTLLDLRGNIPCLIYVSEGRQHEVNLLDELPLEPHTFYVMDRGYLDFGRLASFTENLAYFVTRAKSNLRYRRGAYRPVDYTTGLRCDQNIYLRGQLVAAKYPYPLRYVSYYDRERARWLVFLTNNFVVPALSVAKLYRLRWRVELFFKWIKQNLRIKAFYGTSENAVRTQIWIAVSVYVLLAVIKKELKLTRSLSEIQQVLSTCIFENVPINQLLSKTESLGCQPDSCKQLEMFDL
jgi:hypothetical protein